MRCPFCGTHNDRVVDSRASADGASIRRRRECKACRKRYTTYEQIEQIPLRVVKKDGRRVPLNRNNIFNGMMKACEKRPVSTELLEAAARRIEQEICQNFDKEVSSKHIGTLVMQELREIDKVAYVRFASVYREFKDVNEFLTELQPMLKKGTD